MAVQNGIMQLSFKAGEDLSGKQFYFVKAGSSEGEVVACNALTDVPLGVLQNKPTAGKTAEVMIVGLSKVSSDAALSIGDLIGPSADGQADARDVGTDVTHYVVGQVVTPSTAAGGIASALINCLNPHRAA